MPAHGSRDAWPELPLPAWQETLSTLHMWTQIVGKVRLVQSPWTNHSWHVTFYVTVRGLTTSPIPHGDRSMAEMDRMGLHVEIRCIPCEIADAVAFDQDLVHRQYDADAASRFWRILLQSDRVFKQFRAGFSGKCSPVHFCRGAADLAVTRFSGRPAPRHPGGAVAYPAFHSYAYPQPAGFEDATVQPSAAFYSKDLGEFILPYDAVRLSPDPDRTLLGFLESTFQAAARPGHWP